MVSDRATRSLAFAGTLGAIAAVASVADIVTHVAVLAFIGLVVFLVAFVFLVRAYAVIFGLDPTSRRWMKAQPQEEEATDE